MNLKRHGKRRAKPKNQRAKRSKSKSYNSK